MNVSQIIPLVGQLLTLGLKIADMIERAEDISDTDREAMKAAVKKAQSSVTMITAEDISESGE